jgi:hypothetical protein
MKRVVDNTLDVEEKTRELRGLSSEQEMAVRLLSAPGEGATTE